MIKSNSFKDLFIYTSQRRSFLILCFLWLTIGCINKVFDNYVKDYEAQGVEDTVDTADIPDTDGIYFIYILVYLFELIGGILAGILINYSFLDRRKGLLIYMTLS